MARKALRLEGLEDAKRVFKKLPLDTVKNVTNALNVGAEEVKDLAKSIVQEETGELKGAIEVRADISGFKATGIIGALATGGTKGGGKVQRFIGVFPETSGSPGFYAAFVEFGTSARTKGKAFKQRSGRTKQNAGNTHPGTSPKPFLFPAYFARRKRVVSRIARAINAAGKAAARRSKR